MSEPVLAEQEGFKLPMEPVDIYKMKQSPKGYLTLKAILSDPKREPTDILDFHPSGDYLVSGGDTHTNIRIWDLKTEKAIKTLDKQIASDHVMFTPDGKYLFVDYYLSPDDEKQYKTPYKVLYDTKSYEVSHLDELKNGGAPQITSFNPVSQALYLISGRLPQGKRAYPNIRKYAITDQGFKALSASESQVYGLRNALAWSPDGRYLAVGVTDHGEKGVQDNKQFIGIWDANSLKEVRRIENIYPDSENLHIGALAWSPDSEYLIVGPEDQALANGYVDKKTNKWVYLPSSYEAIQVLNARNGKMLSKLQGIPAGEGLNVIEFLTEDIFITQSSGHKKGGRLLIIWSLSSGKMLEVFKIFNTRSILGFAWHKPSKTLAISSGRIIQLYKFNAHGQN